jgi:hypothetical protein
MIVGFEASDDALIIWLDMHCEIWLEIFNTNVPKIVWNNVT